MKNTVCKVLYSLHLFLQAAAAAALVIVEELTHRKAGVNHHLYYRRAQFNANVLTPEVITVLTVVLVIVLIGLVVWFLRTRTGKISLALTAAWVSMFTAAMHLELFRSTYVYPYLMAVLAVCVLLSVSNLLLAKKIRP